MKKNITVFLLSGTGFSGQRFASELLIEGLRLKGWSVLVVLVPTFDRVSETKLSRVNLFLQTLIIAFKLAITWIKTVFILTRTSIFYVNLGQTKFALIRDGFPLVIKQLIFSHIPAVISLHGSVFMSWDFNSTEAKILRYLSIGGKAITILGEKQKKQLICLGISPEKIVILDNTCSLTPIKEAELLSKHNYYNSISSNQKPITVLYLSSLVETKGYPEFIEAIAHLATSHQISIDAVLCGKISIGREDGNRFVTHTQAKTWIETQISQINKSPCVRLRWINGAVGSQKETLFHQAHIFVLPSRYKIEAQPISMIEALASGCAVITSKIGEIPSTVTEETSLFLEEGSTEELAKAIIKLCENHEQRSQQAINGWKLFKNRFSYDNHIEKWETLLEEILSSSCTSL